MAHIDYMLGGDILRLREMGAVCALKSTSTTLGYLGHTVAFYFFNATGEEIAHKTLITRDAFIVYSRKWGDIIKAHYSPCRFNSLVKDLQIQNNGLYFIG